MGHLHMLSVTDNIFAYSPLAIFLASKGAIGAVVTALAGRRGASCTERRFLGLAAVLRLRLVGRDGFARPERPKRCTLPITALRVTPPSCVATCEALSPSIHNFVSIATRSSVHAIIFPLKICKRLTK